MTNSKTAIIPNLSVLIITYNEEQNICELLETLSFADEIIVVDSYSTDATFKIAKNYPQVKILQHPFENYAAQRNFAIGQANNKWILFLDADERLSDQLINEIKKIIYSKTAYTGYYCYRTFMFKNSKLHFSGWQTDKMIRLFKKKNSYYTPEKTVHEKLIIKGAIGKLKNKITHYTYKDYNSYKAKMIRYGKLKAIEEQKKGTKPFFFHYYLRPTFQFFNNYFFRLGILDGKKGLIICYLNAHSVWVRFQELKMIKK
ncbi:glycosyltransferase involved in cell wall biosynthesis [Flavobacterium sp. 7E]|uniref:glycosyltransferase family 2 protein n=1 Tax=Flavobacterium sp. 7E TaxID=2735898 RepID=UPI00156DD029|nr:glycosyltransferase family 2 protein [Flavobacterium sp. 7E]NRS88252.1 glycosyltransferase involved in cell wall biosynthesis [Flavobacterium sp. 7E]